MAEIDSLFTHTEPRSIITESELRRHIAAASTPMLLLVAVHITSDTGLLDRYESRVGRSPSPVPGGPGVLEEVEDGAVREELIELIARTLGDPHHADYLAVPDEQTFGRMQNIATGLEIGESHTAMNMEQAGFVAESRRHDPEESPAPALKVAIIGAGMTGIDAAVKAERRGLDWEIFEKEAGSGGLWWSARYPGVAVDTPALYYSLSWQLQPEWSRYYPLGAEYRSYLHSIVEKYDLAGRITTGSEVVRMTWLEEPHLWELTVRSTVDGSERLVHAEAVIGGAGHLCRPSYPNVPGRGTFAGVEMHTAQFDPDVDLTGRRVGVVGVGAAGVQVVSSITPVVDHLTVFQRQPVWLSRNEVGEGVISASEHWLRVNLPFYTKWSRAALFAHMNFYSPMMNVVDEEWMREHPDSISAFNEAGRSACLAYIADAFADDPELRAKVTPDFPYGGKRPVRDPGTLEGNGYYASLKQSHVHLETAGIVGVEPRGVRTADGVLHELDVLIWATGQSFDFMSTIDIVGRDGLTLRAAWDDFTRPRTYLGGTIAGFPNFFMNDGPHTGVANGGAGHNFMAEAVNHYALEAVDLMRHRGDTSIEVTQQAYDAHLEEILELMSGLIWSHDSKANTYYRNALGYVILPSPFAVEDLWHRLQVPAEASFVFGRRSSDASPSELSATSVAADA